LFHNRGALWERVLNSKYLGLEALGEGGVSSHEFIWWRDLKLVCGGEGSVWFEELVEWKFGNGAKTRF